MQSYKQDFGKTEKTKVNVLTGRFMDFVFVVFKLLKFCQGYCLVMLILSVQ